MDKNRVAERISKEVYCGVRSGSSVKSQWEAMKKKVPYSSVTESTIIATIPCPDVGYCLFGICLVTHIPYHVPCTFPIVIVSYWVVLSFVRLFTPLAPCNQIRILYASYYVLLD